MTDSSWADDPGMTTHVLSTTAHHIGGRLFAVLWGGLAVVDVARPVLGTVGCALLLLGLIAVCGSGQTPWAAVATGVTGWLVIDGFVQHPYGELGFGPPSWILLGVAVVAVLAVAARTADRRGLR